ncbi:hypothetical protein JKF63_01733 [Porcisia hertigi]|uniref:Adenylate cyclase n=1 Tax=Porcisia hertigi TaxID=2761500 RepID=A0A836IB56_9TRYP|nr:hypothetical protein JKF63_01733 [Porcisia hertigi]
MEGFAASSDTAADTCMREKDDHLTRLIIEKREAAKRIEGLEAEVATLRERLQRRAFLGMVSYDEGLPPTSDRESTLENARADEISTWNRELINTVEELQRALIHLETDSKAQLITLTDRLNHMRGENERLMRENDSLKSRVSDDILRQRQTKRMEVASERFRIAARVRTAGRQRLEAAEANLMEAHDDLYYVQRWDAVLLPQRDVSFVFHFVSKMTFPLQGIEEFAMRVCRQLFFRSGTRYRGYRVGFYNSMEVFAFQTPSDALLFAKECHKELMRLSWSSLILGTPSFSTIVEDNSVLYKGPRIHTCIFSCSPESYVDPVSGEYAFFGPQVAEAVRAAIEQSPVGEIAVNEKWAQLMCLQSRMREGRSALTANGVAELRESLGPTWDVIGLPGARQIIASILPSELRGRRGVQPTVLHPSRKYPCLELKDSASIVREVAQRMKGMLADTFEGGEGCFKRAIGSGGLIPETVTRHPNFLHEAAAQVSSRTSSQECRSQFSETAAKMMEVLSAQEEKKNLIALCRRMEAAGAALERDMMESEDRFEICKHKALDPSETAYICTIDTCDDTIWRRLLMTSISDEQLESIRNTISGHIHNAAKASFGFLMGGNYSDIFTYAFREVEEALAFVSEIYITVNRTATKYAHMSLGKGDDIFLFRAGVVSGTMSTIYRHLENGVLKCTGPAIRLSGTLCDLADFGEILAMEDVIRSFHSKNENLLDTHYNIVKKGSQFVCSSDAPAVVHSILPRPFAYRRQHLPSFGRATLQNKKLYQPYRCILESLTLRSEVLPRQSVLDMMEQQQRRLELGETARMRAEDHYERYCEVGMPKDPLLLNPWLLRCQPQAEVHPEKVSTCRSIVRFRSIEEPEAGVMNVRRSTKRLTFLYCDVADVEKISRAVAPSLLKLVWAHYNYIVQSSVRIFGGYVAKTNSATAYLVVFEEPAMALEAARKIQLEMLESNWPEELRVLESTLHVKDPKTHTVLFNGPRPKMAAHVSDQYCWYPISTASGPMARKGNASRKGSGENGALCGSGSATSLSTVHISGIGVEETFVLGRHSHGGEIRLSRPLLEAAGKGTSGKLLLGQLSMEVVVAPSVIRSIEDVRESSSSIAGMAKKAGGKKERGALKGDVFAEECVVSVPRQLEGRLALLLPSTSTVFVSARLTGENLAMMTASADQSDPLAIRGKDGGEGLSEGTATLDSVTATAAAIEETGLAATALPKAMLLPDNIMAQYTWLVEPSKSTNPLPAAWRLSWDALAHQPADRRAGLSFLEEAKGIQAMLRELIRVYPSTQRQYQALKGILDESATEPPAEFIPVSSNDLAIGGAARKKTSTGNRLSTKVLSPPRSSSAGQGSTNQTRKSEDVNPSDASSTSVAVSTVNRADTFQQYLRFMDFSKRLVTELLNALEIGTEDRSPTRIALPHDGDSKKVAVPGLRPLSGRGGRSAVPRVGPSSGSQKHSRTSSGGRASGTSFDFSECQILDSLLQSSIPLLPSISTPGERLLNTSPSGAWDDLRPPSSKCGLVLQRRASFDSHPDGVKDASELQFLKALDYLDDACRTLTQISGTALGKIAKIPSAPQLRSKTALVTPIKKRL